jgi:hypothetical protein
MLSVADCLDFCYSNSKGMEVGCFRDFFLLFILGSSSDMKLSVVDLSDRAAEKSKMKSSLLNSTARLNLSN